MESSEYQNDWLTAGNVLPLTDPALVEDISKRLTTNAAVMQKETDAEKDTRVLRLDLFPLWVLLIISVSCLLSYLQRVFAFDSVSFHCAYGPTLTPSSSIPPLVAVELF